MSKNIWQDLPKNFYILAPMDDVTDTVFRRIVGQVAPPDLYFTEFANVDSFGTKGWDSTMRKLQFTADEQPLIAQIWGLDVVKYESVARYCAESGFKGIDINMGCPEKGIVKRGCCSALIENHDKAAAIIAAVKRGAGNLPVSVKTRIGLRQITTDDWFSFLLAQNLAAITVHGRTTKEMSKVPAHWDEIAKVVSLRDKLATQTKIIGNGDVLSRHQGDDLMKTTNVDGIMIGRGIFQDINVFNKTKTELSQAQLLGIAQDHIKLYESVWGETKNYAALKKFMKVYINSFPGASELRQQLMLTNEPADALELLR